MNTQSSQNKKAVILLSGGLDSATAAAIAKSEGYELYAISFSYGQRHDKELECARRVGASAGVVRHEVVDFDLGKWGGSSLTSSMDVPLDRDGAHMAEDIPSTYVPARNTIFLSFGLAYAEVVGADTIIIGANQLDYSGYPDCRQEYLRAFEDMANLATKAATVEGRHFTVYAPLLHLSKAEIISRGIDLGVDYSLTWSCYQGLAVPCGRCDSCILRAEGFKAAGIPDPLITHHTLG
ncbi:MAG TPA: 7-cyano-7-deazaguanine synthase QueC [Armatimonadetes bacterium]|nr:7-cyano-7-deazaguanine synthase QueC [Armatimonadota bacterium]